MRHVTLAGTLLGALAAAGCCAFAQQGPDEVERLLRSGPSKSMVEGPLKHALEDARASGQERALDASKWLRAGVSKFDVESPIKDALRPSPFLPLARPPQPDSTRVQPGRVRWHASQADALAAARASGKPVLLFQLLGRLDEAFC